MNKRFGTGFHMLAKPIGPVCNLNCTYCFYTEKAALFKKQSHFKMEEDVLEAFIQQYIEHQDIPEIQFVWQGGEPTLMGLAYFKKIRVLQKKYAGGKRIVNSLQTNGILLDAAWCAFLKEEDFLVGVSLDGPQAIHDVFRRDNRGESTFKQVVAGIKMLQAYGVEYNVLACVSSASKGCGGEVYKFLRELGVKHIQFSPVVERHPNHRALELGLKHAAPQQDCTPWIESPVTDFSTGQGDYGSFLCDVFDIWIREDVGHIFVSNFEWALQTWMGLPSTVCVFSKTCGRAMAIEHNGDIFACDHYVYPEYKLGNILTDSPAELVEGDTLKQFGKSKQDMLHEQCKQCEVLFACNGECPRHRFVLEEESEVGISYLCGDYQKYFRHIHRYMKVMVQLIDNGLDASKVMDVIKGPIAVVLD